MGQPTAEQAFKKLEPLIGGVDSGGDPAWGRACRNP
jgi:hypothetical protein